MKKHHKILQDTWHVSNAGNISRSNPRYCCSNLDIKSLSTCALLWTAQSNGTENRQAIRRWQFRISGYFYPYSVRTSVIPMRLPASAPMKLLTQIQTAQSNDELAGRGLRVWSKSPRLVPPPSRPDLLTVPLFHPKCPCSALPLDSPLPVHCPLLAGANLPVPCSEGQVDLASGKKCTSVH